MSDYMELCEMYGTTANDPDFIDRLIESCSGDNESYEDGKMYDLSDPEQYEECVNSAMKSWENDNEGYTLISDYLEAFFAGDL